MLDWTASVGMKVWPRVLKQFVVESMSTSISLEFRHSNLGDLPVTVIKREEQRDGSYLDM